MSSNQGQQWPSVGKVSTNGHMELLAILSVIFIFILISIHLYARYRRREESVTITIRHSSTPTVIAPPEGLDAATIAALPRFIYRSGSSPTRSAEECAVCLNVAEEGEVMRMLPDCKHVFHIECIDMWLHSHSTCPVCRTKATPGMLKIGFCGFLASPPLPERFGGASSRPVQGDASPPKEGSSEPSQVLRAGNGSRRWLTVVEDGAVDLERQ